VDDTLAALRTRTIWQTVATVAERVPDRAALVAADDAGTVQRISYATLTDRVRAVSGGLATIGVRRGDRVVLWITNTPEWVVTALAAMRIGASAVPINTFLKPPEAAYVLRQSAARHLVMLDAFRNLRMPDMLAEILPEFADARVPGHLYGAALPELRNVVIFQRSGGTHPGAYDLAELEARGRDPDAQAHADAMTESVLGSDLGMVKFTSGSTSFPKGVMLEQGGIVANAVFHSRRIGVDGSDVYFSMMPFFHGGGSIWGLMTMLVNGGTLVFTEAFDASRGAELIEREQATVMMGMLVVELVQAAIEDGRDLSSLRIGYLPNDDARRLMPNVTFGITPFGLTEAYGPVAVLAFDDPPEKKHTCGLPLPGNEIRVVDPSTGLDVEPGEVGEAWVRGNIMRGYWNQADETARMIDEDGWLHSEDLVVMDHDGYVSYAGRLKLMLKVGGENVSIEEVENVVASHDAVAACGVVGVPDRRKDERVRAYVELRPGFELEEDELRSWLESRLARFKMPRDIVFVDAVPRLANGKIDRLELTQIVEAEVNA
jgi:fatty-acyl-CoA synthase